MAKKVFRKSFEIRRSHPLLAYDGLRVFRNMACMLFGRVIFSEIFWVNEGGDNTGTYFLIPELRQAVSLTIDKISNQPSLVKKNHRQAEKYNADYFILARQTDRQNLKKLSNRQLWRVYQKNFDCMVKSHGHAIYTTWFVDSDGEDFTHYLLKITKFQIASHAPHLAPADVFSTLTTPSRLSNAQIEEIETLTVAKKIIKDARAVRAFKSGSTKIIEKELDQFKPATKMAIVRHFRRWRWVPYTYIGPAYDLDYYLEVWSGLIRQQVDFDKLLFQIRQYSQRIKKEKVKLIKALKINTSTKEVFDIAAEIVWLKAYRKDALFHGFYVIDKLYAEIAKRFHLSLNQVRQFNPDEIRDMLLDGTYDIEEANRRIKKFVAVMDRHGLRVLSGPKAEQYLGSKFIEKIKIKPVNKIIGTSACPGKVRGVVKIINIPDEMGKMDAGDIMVSHTTFPALVPAMKKAAAIITDDGGLTCHAAIVARELKKPCVVGTKIATAVLEDGDMVEVDADNGVVRKL